MLRCFALLVLLTLTIIHCNHTPIPEYPQTITETINGIQETYFYHNVTTSGDNIQISIVSDGGTLPQVFAYASVDHGNPRPTQSTNFVGTTSSNNRFMSLSLANVTSDVIFVTLKSLSTTTTGSVTITAFRYPLPVVTTSSPWTTDIITPVPQTVFYFKFPPIGITRSYRLVFTFGSNTMFQINFNYADVANPCYPVRPAHPNWSGCPGTNQAFLLWTKSSNPLRMEMSQVFTTSNSLHAANRPAYISVGAQVSSATITSLFDVRIDPLPTTWLIEDAPAFVGTAVGYAPQFFAFNHTNQFAGIEIILSRNGQIVSGSHLDLCIHRTDPQPWNGQCEFTTNSLRGEESVKKTILITDPKFRVGTYYIGVYYKSNTPQKGFKLQVVTQQGSSLQPGVPVPFSCGGSGNTPQFLILYANAQARLSVTATLPEIRSGEIPPTTLIQVKMDPNSQSTSSPKYQAPNPGSQDRTSTLIVENATPFTSRMFVQIRCDSTDFGQVVLKSDNVELPLQIGNSVKGAASATMSRFYQIPNYLRDRNLQVKLTVLSGNARVWLSLTNPYPSSTNSSWSSDPIVNNAFAFVTNFTEIGVNGTIPAVPQTMYVAVEAILDSTFEIGASYASRSKPADRDVIATDLRAICLPGKCDHWVGDPCADNWPEIFCSSDGEIVAISIHDALSGALPDTLATLSSLQTLDLSSNQITGPLPTGIFGLPLLSYLDLRSNLLTGSIPPEISQLPSLLYLFLGYNRFTDIPQEMESLTSLRTLSLRGNAITGSIPSWLDKLVNLQVLDLSSNQLTGTLPQSLGPSTGLTRLDLGDNALTGTIGNSIESLSALENLNLGKNQFSELVVDFSKLSELTILDMQSNLLGKSSTLLAPNLSPLTSLQELFLNDNGFSGALPEFEQAMASLRIVRFDHNAFSGSIPKSYANLQALELFDVSHNQLTGKIVDVLSPLGGLPVQTVDVSNNQITDVFTLDLVERNFVAQFTSLSSLIVGNNQISGNLPSYLALLPALSVLDCQSNQLTGSIPNDLGFLSELNLVNNPNLRANNDPSFVVPSAANSVRLESIGASCPSYTDSGSGTMKVELDQRYFDMSKCDCLPQYHGVNGSCVRCIPNTVCPGGEVVYIPAGWYPFPNERNMTKLLRCRSTYETPCNPTSGHPYKCRQGYQGRLCSECKDGYSRTGGRCVECTGAIFVIPTIAVLAVIALFAYLIGREPSPTSSGAIKSLIFFAQTSSLLLSNSFNVPISLDVFGRTMGVSNLDFGGGLECISPVFDFAGRFAFALYQPMVLIGLCVVIFLVGSLVVIGKNFHDNISNRLDGVGDFSRRCFYAALYILLAMYFPTVSKTSVMFNCDDTGHLDQYPSVECNTDGLWGQLLPSAILGFVMYGLGIPLVLSALLFVNRGKLNSETVYGFLGFLYTTYQEEYFFFEIVLLLRRFLMSMAISLLPSGSLFRPLAISAVLVAFITIQYLLNPFALLIENALELASLCIILMTFVSGTLFQVSNLSGGRDAWAICLLILNSLMLLSFFAVLAFQYGQRVLPDQMPGLDHPVSKMLNKTTEEWQIGKRQDVIEEAEKRASKAMQEKKANNVEMKSLETNRNSSPNVAQRNIAKTGAQESNRSVSQTFSKPPQAQPRTLSGPAPPIPKKPTVTKTVWKEVFTDDGEKYWWDPVTNKTTWDNPN